MFIGETEKSEEISSRSYLGTLLIGTLPIYGTIMLMKWSKNINVRINKQNICKAYLKLKFIMLYPITLVLICITAFIVSCIYI